MTVIPTRKWSISSKNILRVEKEKKRKEKEGGFESLPFFFGIQPIFPFKASIIDLDG